MDRISTVEHQSWFGRIGNAFVGILFGLALFFASFVALFWNEGRAVTTARSLEEGAASVVTISADQVHPDREGQLIHTSGSATTNDVLMDPQFGIAETAVRLRRLVSMYQWKETTESKSEKTIGGGTTTTRTYTYDKRWSDKLIDSSRFHQPAGHENPGSFPVSPWSADATTVTLGQLKLSHGLIGKMGDWRKRPVSAHDLGAVSPELRPTVKPLIEEFFIGSGSIAAPQVGDVRVRFEVVKPSEISVIARQTGHDLTPYQTKAGRSLELLTAGVVDAEAMFAAEIKKNNLITWGIRLGGMLAMAMGIFLIGKPLAVLGDVIPFVGNMMAGGIMIFAGLAAASLSLITISLAWIVYRPMLGIPMLIVGVGMIVFSRMMAPTRPPLPEPPFSQAVDARDDRNFI